MKLSTVVAVMLVCVLGLGLYCAGVRSGKQKVTTQVIERDDSVMVARLDSAEALNDSLRRFHQKRDTLWRVRVDRLIDSIPVLIAQVDSASCAPVILGLTRCKQELDSARTISNGLQAVIQNDSTNLRGERQRADSTIKSLLKLHPSRWGCVVGPAAGLGINGQGFVGGGLACGWRF